MIDKLSVSNNKSQIYGLIKKNPVNSKCDVFLRVLRMNISIYCLLKFILSLHRVYALYT